jgi:hypothetical protein
MLFSYKIAYKVITRYTPYQLVYGLHPSMPTKYIMPIANANEKYSTTMRVFTIKIIELKKLQETRMQVVKIAKIQH